MAPGTTVAAEEPWLFHGVVKISTRYHPNGRTSLLLEISGA